MERALFSFNFAVRIDSANSADHEVYKAAAKYLKELVSSIDEESLADMLEWYETEDDDDDWKHHLHSGDEITWNDPDAGECSRTPIVANILYKTGAGDGEARIVEIVDQAGSVIERPLREIS